MYILIETVHHNGFLGGLALIRPKDVWTWKQVCQMEDSVTFSTLLDRRVHSCIHFNQLELSSYAVITSGV